MWLEIVHCNKTESVIVIFIFSHVRYRAQDTRLGSCPPDLVFVDLQSKKLFLGEKFLQNDGSIQVLNSLTSEPSRHWQMSGVW